MWNLLNKEPSYQKYTTNPIDAFLTSKSRAPSSFLWSVLPSQPQPAALQSADQMTKQKPQAVLWRFVAQSRGHKASWQIQKNRQLFRSNVAGSTSAKTCPAVNLSRGQRKKSGAVPCTDLPTQVSPAGINYQSPAWAARAFISAGRGAL